MKKIPRILVLIAFICPGTSHLTAQWVQTNGPEGGVVESITEDDMFYYAATRGPIYRMEKNDTIWYPHLPSLTWALNANSLATIGTTVVAGNTSGVHYSSDHGVIFQSYGSGLENVHGVRSFAVNGEDLFAGTDNGVHRSTDHGINWIPANAGMENMLVSYLLIKDSSLFAGTWGEGVYLSTDYGTSWTPVNNGMTTNHINSLAVLDSVIFAGTWYGEGIYRSRDDGMTWNTVNYNYCDPAVNTIAVLDTNLFAGTHGGVIISVDSGDSWILLDNGPQDIVEYFHVSDSNILAGTFAGIYVSSDTGNSWNELNKGLIATSVIVFARSDTSFFAGTENSGLFRSADEGTTWVKTDLRSNWPVTSLLISDPYIFAGTGEGAFRSSNNGDSWITVNLGLPQWVWVTSLAAIGSNLFAGTQSHGVYLSTDDGASWMAINSGLTDMAVRCLAVRGTNLYAGTGSGEFLSTNNGTTWTPIDNELTGTGIFSIAQNDEFLFATTDSGLFRSGDDGATWVKTNMPDAGPLVVSGADIFAGVYHSPNNGATWDIVDLGLIKCASVQALSISDTNLFAGMSGAGVWKRPLSEMNISEGLDFALNDTVCEGEEIPALAATGDSIKWYSNPDFTGLLHSGNNFETGQTENGTYTYYVTQWLNSLVLKDSASLIISSRPVIDSVGKTNESTCNSDDGTITINATDENPLFYSINGGDDYFDNGGSFSGLSNGIYQVVVMNSNGCQATGGIIEIISEGFIPPAPIAGNDTVYCIGHEIKDITAIALSGGTITWYADPGLSDVIGTGTSYSPGSLTETTTYYVTETKDNCESPSANITIRIINEPVYEDEELCIITIDLATGKNLLVWEKTPGVGIASYNIYKETSVIGQYEFIDNVAYDQLSVYGDSASKPEESQSLYKITAVDSCGNESEKSSYHKPLFLQYVGSTGGVNLQWSDYEIEGGEISFITYEIYRGEDPSSLEKIGDVSASVDRFTDTYEEAKENKFYYRIAGVKTDPCFPTGTLKGTQVDYSRSMSNLEDNKVVSVRDNVFKDHLKVYPNPFSHSTRLRFNNPENQSYSLCIMDLTGKVCRVVDNITASEFILEKGNLKEGFYFVELRGPRIFRGKIIIE